MISVVLIFASYGRYSQQPVRVLDMDMLTDRHRQGCIPSSTPTYHMNAITH